MNNLIELLKKNKYPFGLMSEEMQEKASQIGQNRFWKYLMSEDGEQCGFTDAKRDFDEYKSLVFRLRPDYADEPEIVECKITIGGCTAWMDKLVYTDEKVLEQGICEASVDPDFIGFKFESGQVEFSPIVFKSDCSTKSICQFRDLADLEVLHATHVLFKRKKQE